MHVQFCSLLYIHFITEKSLPIFPVGVVDFEMFWLAGNLMVCALQTIFSEFEVLNCPFTITQQRRPSISKFIVIYVVFLLYSFIVFVISWNLLHSKTCSVWNLTKPRLSQKSRLSLQQVTPIPWRMNMKSWCRFGSGLGCLHGTAILDLFFFNVTNWGRDWVCHSTTCCMFVLRW